MTTQTMSAAARTSSKMDLRSRDGSLGTYVAATAGCSEGCGGEGSGG
eukprot:CAMPEP_0183361670 /NCGR_PEP_ID=MMETSP0164_2-20130417/63158_1 /TAXON_ID=221442 /ORGANISM="Coccolithus pelagicus ssp braarudi, Strain PLY182g" /LENGTH=46 /DNA_ID= /DNA_START= /DNA_END= /DNA_ORIENTATION=